MRLLVITSNSLRHFALLATLARTHTVTALIQVPGAPAVTGPAQHAYYQRMAAAERAVFPAVPMLPCAGAVVPLGPQAEAIPWDFDRAVVFGGGIIGGDLLAQCQAHEAINLHAGITPQYRGTACNFWAAYDGHPELVGCTLHALTAEVDRGAIYGYTYAKASEPDPWLRSMQAVADAIALIPSILNHPEIIPMYYNAPLIRYSRAADFTETVAAEFLARQNQAWAAHFELP